LESVGGSKKRHRGIFPRRNKEKKIELPPGGEGTVKTVLLTCARGAQRGPAVEGCGRRKLGDQKGGGDRRDSKCGAMQTAPTPTRADGVETSRLHIIFDRWYARGGPPGLLPNSLKKKKGSVSRRGVEPHSKKMQWGVKGLRAQGAGRGRTGT